MFIDRLKSILRVDTFTHSLAVFPDINAEQLADLLKIRRKSKERGLRNEPSEASVNLDSVEMEIVAKVESARRVGLESYQNNINIYKERASKVEQVKQEVQIITGVAKTDFQASIRVFSNELQNELKDVKETFNGYENFKTKNRIKRPAESEKKVINFFAQTLFFLSLESVANGLLFAEDNPLGLLGGIGVALLISIINIGLSIIGGYFGRWINHIRIIPKFLGMLVYLSWISGSFFFNLAVGHYRDVVGSTGEARQDGILAIQNLITNPFGITQFNSWILVGVGVLISTLVLWKTNRAGDPYPGYGLISKQMKLARQNYAQKVQDSINSVLQQRDEAVQKLQDAQSLMSTTTEESIQALVGVNSINLHLQEFLQHCNVRVNQLFAIYRDENRLHRSTPTPKRFNDEFQFKDFNVDSTPIVDPEFVNTNCTTTFEKISSSIKEIFVMCSESIEYFRSIEELETETTEKS